MSKKSKARPNNGRIIEPISTSAYLRTRMGLTQGDIAKAAGLTRNDVSRFEHGNRCLSLDKVKRLANFYGISLYVLLSGNICDAITGFPTPVKPKRTLLDRIRAKREHNDRVGVKGEDWVVEQERQRLAGTKFENAVNPNFANDPHSNFDILSFDARTNVPVIIEVKTTTKAEDEPYNLTEGERLLLLSCLEKGIPYELHRVYFIDDANRCSQIIYTASEFIKFFDIRPTNYIVKRSKVA